MKIVAVDPGKNGAIVALDYETNKGHYHKLTYDKDGVINDEPILSLIDYYQPRRIFLEKVGGRGGWGVTQVFNFGSYYGQLKLILSRVSQSKQYVTPMTWQKVAHAGIDTKLTPKERSLVAYQNLFPTPPIVTRAKKPHDGVMDAILILVWAFEKYGLIAGPWQFEEVK